MHLLEPENHYKALSILQKAKINTLFAESVANNSLQADIFVEDINNPTIFYVCHPYNMSFLCGRFDNSEFNKRLIEYINNKFQKRKSVEWLQVYPEGWNDVIQSQLGSRLLIEENGKSYSPDIHENDNTKK